MKKPIKCASKDFTSGPFYYIQKAGSDKRFVASIQNVEKLNQFLTSFINNSEDIIQIKIRDFDDPDNPCDYDGEVSVSTMLNILVKYETVIFHDGFHDLMIRRPETGDYITLDEHGIIFIYTEDNYSEELERLGLSHKENEKLIYHFNHWHYRPENSREELKKLIDELGME